MTGHGAKGVCERCAKDRQELRGAHGGLLVGGDSTLPEGAALFLPPPRSGFVQQGPPRQVRIEQGGFDAAALSAPAVPMRVSLAHEVALGFFAAM